MKNLNPADWTHSADYYFGIDTFINAEFSRMNNHARKFCDDHPRHPEAGGAGDRAFGGHCDHCGAIHNYGSVFMSKDGWMAVGHKCAENFGLPDIATLRRKRATEAANARKQRLSDFLNKARKLSEMIKECPELKMWLRSSDKFAKSLRACVFTWGWSERQREAGMSAARRYADRLANPIEEVPAKPALPAPSGRFDGMLKLVFTKEVDSDFGVTIKGLWVHEDGWKAWFTVPSQAEKGESIHLRVTLTPKKDDPAFAWGSRPSVVKNKVLTPLP